MQDSARSDYQLTNYARLLGGTQLTLPPVGTGSAYVTGDSEGFTVSPEAALAQYITMLNSGTQDTTQFVADDFTKTYLSQVTDLNSSVSAAGTVTAAATATDYPISGLVLQDGSALVAANFKYTLTYQRTVAGATMNLGGKTATMSTDGTTVEGTATAEYIATSSCAFPRRRRAESRRSSVASTPLCPWRSILRRARADFHPQRTRRPRGLESWGRRISSFLVTTVLTKRTP